MNDLRPILYVEDDPQDTELTLAAFSQSNLANEIVVVNDGAKALDYLFLRGEYKSRSPGNPAFVLLDLKMPKVDGLEVLRQMKTEESLRLIPVIMLTSSREERDLVVSYRSGANAYVVKPIGFGEFMNSIKEIGIFWAVINESPVGRAASAEPGSG